MDASVETKTVIRPGRLAGAPVCIFVSYSPDGSVKPHVAYHMAAIRACGFRTILVLVVDRIVNKSWKKLVAEDQPLIVRRNAGFDFGAWADTFRLFPELWRAGMVLLVNDSVFGPLHGLGPVFERAMALSADVVALTDAAIPKRHLQSYFLLLKRSALAKPGMQRFWAQVENLPTKENVIDTYELNFYNYCTVHGLRGAPVFALDDYRDAGANPTINLWNVLLERGYPYLKVALFKALIDKQRWRDIAPALGNPELAGIISDYIQRHIPAHDPAGPEPTFVYDEEGRRVANVADRPAASNAGHTTGK